LPTRSLRRPERPCVPHAPSAAVAALAPRPARATRALPHQARAPRSPAHVRSESCLCPYMSCPRLTRRRHGNNTPECAAGTYNAGPGGNRTTCTACVANSSSIVGAATCTCNAGYASTGTGNTLTCTRMWTLAVPHADVHVPVLCLTERGSQHVPSERTTAWAHRRAVHVWLAATALPPRPVASASLATPPLALATRSFALVRGALWRRLLLPFDPAHWARCAVRVHGGHG
jgi:hypothetical protein